MTLKLNKSTAARGIPTASDAELEWLLSTTRRELHKRRRQRVREAEQARWRGLSNFLTGVTWALACRQSLRRSKGHTPDTGKTPASGEMWWPYEMLTAARAEVKERTWSPLTATCAGHVMNWLNVELHRTPPREDVAFKFHVRMAAPQYAAVHFDENVLTGRS